MTPTRISRTLRGQWRPVPENGVSRVSLPRPVYVVAVLFGVLMLVTLAVQLVMINDQRTTNDKQLAIQARQSARAIPLLDDTRALSEEVRGSLPDAQQLAQRAQELARDAQPLLEDLEPALDDLANAQIDENLRAAGALAATLLNADVGDATRAGRALAVEVLRADLPTMARYVNAASSELLYKHRLRRLLVRSLTVTGQMRDTDFVRKLATIVPEQARLLRRSVAVQEETLRTNKRALAAIEETLKVARETERHAESLDNKTGGSGTTVVPPPTEGQVP
jgi:hypothetical protein